MNKKILFYYSQLNIGGAEKSLIRLMNALANDGNDVTMLTRYSRGKAEQFLDNRVKKIALSGPMGNGGIFDKLRVGVQRTFQTSKLKCKKPEYDLAIVGLQGLSPAILPVLISAKQYVQCIRSDLAGVASKERILETLRINQELIDGYLCVSQTARDSLVNAIPELQDKAFVLYNLLEAETMRRMAQEADNPFGSEQAFKIVSVCRISDKAKGVFRMLDCLEVLVNEGYDAKWFLVGDGSDLPRLKQEIEKRGLCDRFITVGNKDNPFGYYKYADLVAVPSYYEGLCGVVNEAKITGCAVLATEFSGIYEQLTSGENGLIVENNQEAILAGLRKLLDDRELLSRIKNDHYPTAITDDGEKIRELYRRLGWSE